MKSKKSKKCRKCKVAITKAMEIAEELGVIQ
jgi:hypothetical protein